MADADVLPFKVEYAKSNRSICNACKKNIGKSSIRIAAMVSSWYVEDTKVAKWYHYSCVFKKKSISSVDDIDGFSLMRPEDQEKIRIKITPTTKNQKNSRNSTAVSTHTNQGQPQRSSDYDKATDISRKRKNNDSDTDTKNKRDKIDEDMALTMKLRDQTIGLWSIYDNLRKECNDEMLNEMLIYNNQKLVADTMGFHLVVDGMAFGALKPCKECSGILFYSRKDHGYRCLRCHNLTQKPDRTQWKIPDELCAKSKYLKEYNSIPRERIFVTNISANSDESRSDAIIQNKTNENTIVVNHQIGTHHVIKDSDGTVYSINLENGYRYHNFYQIQALQSDTSNQCFVFQVWGSINSKKRETSLETGYSMEEAMLIFDQIYFEKTGNTFGKQKFIKLPHKFYPVYLKIEKNEEERQIDNIFTSKGSKVFRYVRSLLQRIFNLHDMQSALLEFKIDLNKIKLSSLSTELIDDALQRLSRIRDLILARKTKKDILDAVNNFYTVIPHNFGLDKQEMLDDVDDIQKKEIMLDDLKDILTSYELIKKAQNNPENSMNVLYWSLKTKITYLYSDDEEFKMVKKYAENSHLPNHDYFSLTINEVFKILKYGEDKQYQQFSNFDNRMLLWFQTRTISYGSMLSRGVRFTPPKSCLERDYIYGKGVYFTDSASKCAFRCEPTLTNPTVLMCLCEVALGQIHEDKFPKCYEKPKMPETANSFKCPGDVVPDPSGNITLENGTIVPLGKMMLSKNGSGSNEYPYAFYS